MLAAPSLPPSLLGASEDRLLDAGKVKKPSAFLRGLQMPALTDGVPTALCCHDVMRRTWRSGGTSESRQVRLRYTLCGDRPGTRPLSLAVPYKVYMGPSVGDLFFTTLEELDQTLSQYRGATSVFIARKIRCC